MNRSCLLLLLLLLGFRCLWLLLEEGLRDGADVKLHSAYFMGERVSRAAASGVRAWELLDMRGARVIIGSGGIGSATAGKVLD